MELNHFKISWSTFVDCCVVLWFTLVDCWFFCRCTLINVGEPTDEWWQDINILCERWENWTFSTKRFILTFFWCSDWLYIICVAGILWIVGSRGVRGDKLKNIFSSEKCVRDERFEIHLISDGLPFFRCERWQEILAWRRWQQYLHTHNLLPLCPIITAPFQKVVVMEMVPHL